MATLKIKFRESCVDGKAGTIYYQITHHRKVLQITSGIHLKKEEWSEVKKNIYDPNLKLPAKHYRISNDIYGLKQIIHELDNQYTPYTVDDIVSRFKSTQYRTSIKEYMKREIYLYQDANRNGTARNYNRTLSSFSQFLKGNDITINAVNSQLIEEYNIFLIKRGLVRNSISFYMRILRAVYNKAVHNKITIQTFPFQNVYTGIDKTHKRAIDEMTIAKLFKLKLKQDSQLSLARDMFILSYCTRGMAFVDMAYLKKSNIQNGMICYSRRKTGQLLCIKIEKQINEIICKYSKMNSKYVFPIIQSDEPNKAYKEYEKAINEYNNNLKKLSVMLPEECKLTSYTARHSWATTARNHNIPVSIISAGLGHTTEKTTRIYLATLENSIIDDANKQIIDLLDI